MNLLVPTLEVQMECYEGPLAVLVTLIKRNKVSIWDVSLSDITERFLQYVEIVSDMNLKIAEDFIDIASLLIFLKSKLLLPSGNGNGEDETGEGLIDRILEYERIKGMAETIDSLPMLYRDTFCRGGSLTNRETDYDLLSLCMVFFELLKSKEERFIVIREIRPTLEERLAMLKEVIDSAGQYVWDLGIDEEQNERVATMLGILELTKLKKVTIVQRRPFGTIVVKRKYASLDC